MHLPVVAATRHAKSISVTASEAGVSVAEEKSIGTSPAIKVEPVPTTATQLITKSMKTLNTTIATACLGLALGNIGFSQTPNRSEDSSKPAVEEKSAAKEHLMMTDGKVVVMKGSKTMDLDKTVTLEDGTKVTPDGTITLKDGKTMKMDKDDLIMMDGKMSKRTHLMLKDGKMMVVKDGKASPMEKDMTLENGTKVAKDGTVTMKDGKTTKVVETDMILLDGTMAKIPEVPAGPRDTN